MKKKLVGQRFKIGDVVYRKNIFGHNKKLIDRTGVIKGITTKKNSAGSSYYYYQIHWNDRTKTENAQHSLDLISNYNTYSY